MWCGLGNKQKSEGKYREALKNKIMFHSKKSIFGRIDEREKGMRRCQKILIDW